MPVGQQCTSCAAGWGTGAHLDPLVVQHVPVDERAPERLLEPEFRVHLLQLLKLGHFHLHTQETNTAITREAPEAVGGCAALDSNNNFHEATGTLLHKLRADRAPPLHPKVLDVP